MTRSSGRRTRTAVKDFIRQKGKLPENWCPGAAVHRTRVRQTAEETGNVALHGAMAEERGLWHTGPTKQ